MDAGGRMNRQGKKKNGRWAGGIEWTRIRLADGTELPGFTWNPVGGCSHACRWRMPNGDIAICYAEHVAERVAQTHYSHGFAHHYWHPARLDEPLKHTESAGIFLDSMSDLMGVQVPDEQVRAVFTTCRSASWHIFQLLTKNGPRLLRFVEAMPTNVWPGISSAPDFMHGRELTRRQQERYMHRALEVLNALAESGFITWISFEPLSWDVAPIVSQYPGALRWAVIGAASNGPALCQPQPDHVQALLDVLDEQSVPVFFKGNMVWEPWRDEFPVAAPASRPPSSPAPVQATMLLETAP